MLGGDWACGDNRVFHRLPDGTCCNAFEDWEHRGECEAGELADHGLDGVMRKDASASSQD
jgi:hypothetical protein